MKKNTQQNNLFSFENQESEWIKEWQGMPEFIQCKSNKAYAQIIFRFRNENDLQDFAKLIGQKLTNKTKSAWHPQIERGLNANKIYVYEP